MAEKPTFKGHVKSVHTGSKAKKYMRTGEVQPIEGNLMGMKFETKLNVNLGDSVEFTRNPNDRTAIIKKITRKSK